MNKLEARQEKRFQLLKRVYEESNGDTSTSFNVFAIGEELGWDNHTTKITAFYLRDESLLQIVARDFWLITHAGVKEIEDALAEPEQSTEHFPAQVVQYIMNVDQMTNSLIQQGTIDSIQSIQTRVGEAGVPDELRKLLSQLTAAVDGMISELPEEEARRAARALETLTDEATSKEPQRRWWEVSVEGLKKAAENVGEIGKPVLELAAQIAFILMQKPG